MAYQYDPDDKFGFKDTLPEGHPEKVIRGTEFDDEFRKIALSSQESSDALAAEIAARISGDENLQQQINDILSSGGGGGTSLGEAPLDGKQYGRQNAGWTEIIYSDGGVGGGASTWDELAGKPTEFPPEDHTHDQYALSTDLDTEIQARIDGDAALDLRIDAVEDSITSGGGFVDAPDDGKLYGRQSENWAEVVIPDVADPDWADIQNKPTEFTPEAHVHTIANVTGLQDALDDKADADHTHEIADVNGLQDALNDAGGGGGSPVHIGDTAPSDPAEGDLWYDASSDNLFLFDGTAWFSTESCGSGGGGGVLSDSLFKEEFILISEYEFDKEEVRFIDFNDLDGSYDQHILVYSHLAFTGSVSGDFLNVNPKIELSTGNDNSGSKTYIGTGKNGRSSWATNEWEGQIDTTNSRPFLNTTFVNGKTRIMGIGKPQTVAFITEYISMAPHGNYGYQSGYTSTNNVAYNAFRLTLHNNHTSGHIALYGVNRT